MSWYKPRPKENPNRNTVAIAKGIFVHVNGAGGSGHDEPFFGTKPDWKDADNYCVTKIEILSPTAVDVSVMGFGEDVPAPGKVPTVLNRFEVRCITISHARHEDHEISVVIQRLRIFVTFVRFADLVGLRDRCRYWPIVIFSTVQVEQSPLYSTVSDSQCSSWTRQPLWPWPSEVCAQPTSLPSRLNL